MHSVLITGFTGALGNYLMPALSKKCIIHGISRTSSGSRLYNLDILNEKKLVKLLKAINPDTIIHAAACTDVDKCQRDPNLAFGSNVSATRNVVNWIKGNSPKTKLIYISSDQVYGEFPGPHRIDAPNPINIYGWSKLWGEDLARTVSNHLVLRLNYVGVGTRGKVGFLEWLYKCLQSNEAFPLFQNVVFNPLSGVQVGKIIVNLISEKVKGTYNLGSECSGISKAEFAIRLARLNGLKIEHGYLEDLNQKSLSAPRPLDTRMNVHDIQKHVEIPQIDEVIKCVSKDFLRLGNLS